MRRYDQYNPLPQALKDHQDLLSPGLDPYGGRRILLQEDKDVRCAVFCDPGFLATWFWWCFWCDEEHVEFLDC